MVSEDKELCHPEDSRLPGSWAPKEPGPYSSTLLQQSLLMSHDAWRGWSPGWTCKDKGGQLDMEWMWPLYWPSPRVCAAHSVSRELHRLPGPQSALSRNTLHVLLIHTAWDDFWPFSTSAARGFLLELLRPWHSPVQKPSVAPCDLLSSQESLNNR